MRMVHGRWCWSVVLLMLWSALSAHEPAGGSEHPEEVLVLGRWDNPLGYGISASQGVVGADEIDTRPRTRTGDLLEVVPGLIVTQHSGTGKANQMFLRGFNLDHGTDFATWVDGMPVNMPTHGHGQGYTDLNFLIPELIERLEYRKGPYYAEVSDFSSAGAAYMSTYERLEQDMVKAGVGENGYLSAFGAGSFPVRSGELLYAIQGQRYDGPWVDVSEDVERGNVLMRYSVQSARGASWNVALMGYDARWNAADQIPRRAVQNGLISALGSLDTTLRGETSRYSLSGSWTAQLGQGRARLNAYAIDYSLSLFSNFTYFLDNPNDGDQFEQLDERTVTGGGFAYDFGDESATHTIGAMLRYDDIADVGLFRTANLRRLSTVRRDSVGEGSLGFYYSNDKHWGDRLRTTLGIRMDWYDFDVASGLLVNSGSANEAIVSPKASLIYIANDTTELYVSAGKGFHSNDARGTTITLDPATGDPARRVNPLVESRGVEIGFRSFIEQRLNISAALWVLELDSELVFIGDAGNTEASRPSRRYGLEVPLYYRPADHLTFDFELALAESKFTEFDPAGDEISGSIDRVLSAGFTVDRPEGVYGSVRVRYFGPRPLSDDGSVESKSSAAWRVDRRGRFAVEHRGHLTLLDIGRRFSAGDESGRVWMFRVAIHTLCRPDFAELARMHHCNPATYRAYEQKIV